jgi:hypothetical protein
VTAESRILAIVDALGLPPDVRVDARVPKKLLVEQSAPTSADKRAIQDGIEELQWLAACKPTTIGVPSFADDVREYLEISVVSCVFRPSARAARLIELIHRAIPYPVLLVTIGNHDMTVSAAHKRRAQNEPGRSVVEQLVVAHSFRPGTGDTAETAFLQSLSLLQQPRSDLHALYSGWIARIEALKAAHLTGVFAATDDADVVRRRRIALDVHARLAKKIATLRDKAKREKQLSRRVRLNVEIQHREADLAANKKEL